MEINKSIYQIAKDLLDTCVDVPSKAINTYEVLKEFLVVIEEYVTENDIPTEHINLDFTNGVYSFGKEPIDGEAFEGAYTNNKILKQGEYRGICIKNSETNELEFSLVLYGKNNNSTVVLRKENGIWKVK